jgi:hypothetical protein
LQSPLRTSQNSKILFFLLCLPLITHSLYTLGPKLGHLE